MAENINALILPIGADATQFERSINDVKSAFKELSATIAATPFNLVTDKQKLQLNALKETLTVLTTDVKTFGQAIKIPENSILGLTQKIAELNKKKISLDAKTSASEIARLTIEIEKLTTQKNNIDALGASVQKIGQSGATSFKKLEDSSKRGRLAINSLSLVAQDLPFGFIAIQNNLPAVISSFGALSVGSKGLSASLIALKGALIGPAGLFLAFSVITGALTFAVQKYGSFGAALDAITGNTNEFTKSILKANKSLEEYNKESKSTTELRNDAIGSVEDEIIKVNTLAEVLRTSTSTDRQKQGALAELKKANDEYFGKLNAQKIDLDLLNESVGKYTESLIKNKVAQNIASEAASVYTEFLKQNQIAFDISQKINAIFKEVPTLTKQLDNYNKKRDKLIATGEITSIRFIPISKELNQYLSLNEELREVNVNVKSTANSYGLLKTQADLAYKAASGFLDLQKDDKKGGEGKGAKNQFTLGLDSQELDAAFNLESIISSINKYGNALLDTNKSVEERKNALKELVSINPQVFSGLTLEKTGLVANKDIIEQYIRSLQVLIKNRKDDARASEINTQFRNAALKKADEETKADEELAASIANLTTTQDKYGSSTVAATLKSLAFLKVLKQQQDISAAINKGLNNIYGPGTAEENDPVKRIEDLSKRIKQAKENFENTIRRGLQQPFEDFFSSLIETGKFSLDSFEGLFKDMLKRIAAQIISAGIAKLISSILFPPGAAAGALAGAAAGNSAGGGIIGALVSLFGGRRSAFNNVNFGGVEGGGMQMAGAVNLTLRGSDLVGSINRTNTTINRVG
jgi:hypothetical protein